ncbi:MAG: acyl-CoA dehydrogenase family protein [Oscillospiraceae bacterium]|nr:acyl-CoA dehydrogenase family protein [Oscillospiraceae bacterium]
MTVETNSPYFTKEHNALRAQAKEFANRVLAPAAAEIDRTETFPQEIVDQMAQLGYFGLRIPTTYGGKGLDMRSYVCVMEELAKKCATATLYVSSANSLSTAPLVFNGTEPQKRAWIPGVVDGTRKITFALTEPGAGSDAASLRTTAVQDGDNYILNGTKCFITFAPLAVHHIVYAKTDPDKGAKGITAFLVDRDMPGVIVGDHLEKMGQRGVPVSDLILQNVRVPKQRIIGEKNLGFINAMKTLSVGRIGVASMCLGLMGEALDLAVEHLKGRQQFGKTLSKNQALRFTVAEMATKVKAAQELVYHAAWRMDQGENADMEASMAKLYAAETGIEVVNKALQMFGGYGYARGYAIERIYRDIRVCAIYEGSSEVQKIVIAGNLFGKTANTAKQMDTPAAHPITGQRKRMMLNDGTLEERAAQLAGALKGEGYDFSLEAPIDTPVSQADRLVSAGRGIGEQANMRLIAELAQAAGAAISGSKPAAESLGFISKDRFVGMTGQKFNGSLYIACGISGASPHLEGIKTAKTIVAINIDPSAPIFEACDYGIVADAAEFLPLLTAALRQA